MDGRENNILVLIPAFNEEQNIAAVVSSVVSRSLGADILVVDDGSSDSTARLAREAGAVVVSLPFNMGYGLALKTGFKFAVAHGYEFVIHLDADGQHDPRSISALLKEIRKGEVDIVIGSRFLGTPRHSHTVARTLGIRLFRTITNIITRGHITDPTSGFQGLNRRAMEFYACYYPVDYPDADVIISSCFAGMRISEVPIDVHPRAAGKSMHSGIGPLYYIFKMFLSIFVVLLNKGSVTLPEETGRETKPRPR